MRRRRGRSDSTVAGPARRPGRTSGGGRRRCGRPGWPPSLLKPAFVCGTPELVARQTWSGVTWLPFIRMADEEEESPYGQPLWFDPQPRLLRADSTEGLAFDDVLIVGDIETVEFERWSSAAGDIVTETWTRTGMRTFAGQLVSSFNPTWSGAELWGRHRPATPRVRQSLRALRHAQDPKTRRGGRGNRR